MTSEEVVRQVVEMLSAYDNEPDDALDILKESIDRKDLQGIVNTTTRRITSTLVSNICDFGVLPEKEVMEIFERTR